MKKSIWKRTPEEDRFVWWVIRSVQTAMVVGFVLSIALFLLQVLADMTPR